MLAPGVDDKMGDGQERKVLDLEALWEPLQREWLVEVPICDSSKHEMLVFCISLGRARSRQESSRRRARAQGIVFCSILGAIKVDFRIRRSKMLQKIGYGDAGGRFASAKWPDPVPVTPGFRIQGLLVLRYKVLGFRV